MLPASSLRQTELAEKQVELLTHDIEAAYRSIADAGSNMLLVLSSACPPPAAEPTGASTTLADLLTPLRVTNPFSTMRASLRR